MDNEDGDDLFGGDEDGAINRDSDYDDGVENHGENKY